MRWDLVIKTPWLLKLVSLGLDGIDVLLSRESLKESVNVNKEHTSEFRLPIHHHFTIITSPYRSPSITLHHYYQDQSTWRSEHLMVLDFQEQVWPNQSHVWKEDPITQKKLAYNQFHGAKGKSSSNINNNTHPPLLSSLSLSLIHEKFSLSLNIMSKCFPLCVVGSFSCQWWWLQWPGICGECVKNPSVIGSHPIAKIMLLYKWYQMPSFWY